MYKLLRPLIFFLDAETAHGLAIAAMRLPPARLSNCKPDAMLRQELAGLEFAGPIGLAAGFDKDGRVAHHMARFGFGSAELGTLTPLPQSGNPRPRLFRLTEDGGVINRMGFNNGGQAAAVVRLAQRRRQVGFPVGVNIGANKDTADRIADYEQGVRVMSPYADYLTVNISSPNTPGLRALQDRAALDELLGRVMAARRGQGGGAPEESYMPPIFLKVAPDLQPADMDDIAELALVHRIDALIVSNTTISRPALRSALAQESGGLSGAPLHDLALTMLKAFRSRLGTRLPLIGVGGIETAEQAYLRIRAGASLLQLYSALVYHGPYLAARINEGLADLLHRDGFTSVGQAVGVDVD